jgi:hypothetical protein
VSEPEKLAVGGVEFVLTPIAGGETHDETFPGLLAAFRDLNDAVRTGITDGLTLVEILRLNVSGQAWPPAAAWFSRRRLGRRSG